MDKKPAHSVRKKKKSSKAALVASKIDVYLKDISKSSSSLWNSPRSWTYDNKKVMVQYNWPSAPCLTLKLAEKYLKYLETGGTSEHFNVEDTPINKSGVKNSSLSKKVISPNSPKRGGRQVRGGG